MLKYNIKNIKIQITVTILPIQKFNTVRLTVTVSHACEL